MKKKLLFPDKTLTKHNPILVYMDDNREDGYTYVAYEMLQILVLYIYGIILFTSYSQ